MLKDTHTQTPQSTHEQSTEHSPLNIVNPAGHHATPGGKLRGSGAITPPSTGVTTVSSGAVITKP